MSRALWFAAGAGAGVYAMIRGRRAADALSPDGMRTRLQALGVGARMLRAEVAQGRADKETELRERLGLAPHGAPRLAAASPHTDTTSDTPQINPPTNPRQEGDD